MIPAAVIPLNDFVLNAGLKIAEHFDLPYNSNKTITLCRTKDLMKEVLESKNIPVVKSHRFSTIEEAKKLANNIGFPLVIKPLNFGGSGGVIKVENNAELEKNITLTQTHLKMFAEKYDSDADQMLMEPYIQIKREISAEVINTPTFRHVISITDKFLSQEPYFSETGHIVPSLLYRDKCLSAKITEMALKACEALNINYGMAHVEMKIGPDGEIIVIEVGARTAGDGIMDLYEKSTHVNIYELHCKAFLNQLTENELPKEFFNTSAIGYLHPEKGLIKKINLESLTDTDLTHVDLVAIRTQVGQKIESPKDWSTRYGFVEYTLSDLLYDHDFDLIKTTNTIAKKVFSIGTE